MKAFDNPQYLKDVEKVAALSLPWEILEGMTIAISGASGMIGSSLIDVLLTKDTKCTVIALVRDIEKANERFARHSGDNRLVIFQQDVNNGIKAPVADFIIHAASCTHPIAYATKPIETILTNIQGTKNMLDYAVRSKAKRFAFLSSNEIYGTNRGDSEYFDESYCGYIDCNTLRAGYPEGKRCGEALCQAFASEYGLDIVIPRVTRCFGPSLLPDDSKALSQFIGNAVRKENIVLKSKGDQCFSYIYVMDAVSAILTILLKGKSNEAYNIADKGFDITLKELASLLATIAGTNVVFALPNAIEQAGFSKATIAKLDSHKLQELGWTANFKMSEALSTTIECIRYDEKRSNSQA